MEHAAPGPARPASGAVRALYDSFLQSAIHRFFERVRIHQQPVDEPATDQAPEVRIAPGGPGRVELAWLGRRYVLTAPSDRPFTILEYRLARAIVDVLVARYRAILDPEVMAEQGDLFHGTVEDRFIGAFLDPRPYAPGSNRTHLDRVASAIDVLRVAAVSSYENRLISTGLLLLADLKQSDRISRVPLPSGQRYAEALTGIKTFYRLADGLHTVFLVGSDDTLVDIVDIERWSAEMMPGVSLGAPCADTYQAHARATARGGHICLVLSPFHEMKVFAEGEQLFTFRNATWHLLDLREKFEHWAEAVGSRPLAERLFQTALDLADAREGALFAVVRDPRDAVPRLVSSVDRLDVDTAYGPVADGASRRKLLRLLSGRSVLDLDRSVLASLATVDGAVVLDRAGNLIAAGAILRHPPMPEVEVTSSVEGARTTAALVAARFGPVLKVSEDGVITFFDARKVWEI